MTGLTDPLKELKRIIKKKEKRILKPYNVNFDLKLLFSCFLF